MNKTLQITSIQHRLALSLNASLEIDEILKRFLRACNTRLNLISSPFFLYYGNNDHPCNEHSYVNGGSIKHFISVPEQQNGKPYQYSSRVLNCTNSLEKEKQISKTIETENIYLFSVKDISVFASEYHPKNNNSIKNTKAYFRTIFTKLHCRY